MQAIKRMTFADLPVTIVTPSEHLGRAVRQSGVFQAAIHCVIPYGVDTDTFHPHCDQARAKLGLSPGRPVVALVAQGLDDPRKGLCHAVESLQQADIPGLVVLLAGGGDGEPIATALSMHEVRNLGYIADRPALSDALTAADLFLFTSLAENYPCVVQEAMACGTPVLGFAIEGVDEQITPDRTSFLVPPGDTDALTQAASRLLVNRARLAEVGSAARHHAETVWTVDLFTTRHERLYREVLARAATDQDSTAKPSTQSPNT
jgi:glycosyltransferase involved in cell wall biosynthesis